jgi:hypothetical protein
MFPSIHQTRDITSASLNTCPLNDGVLLAAMSLFLAGFCSDLSNSAALLADDF